jgi:hypothetical protein
MTMMYPVLVFLETQAIQQLCREFTPGMSKQDFFAKAQQSFSTLILAESYREHSAIWQASIKPTASLLEVSCRVRGVGEEVAVAEIIRNGNIETP